MYNDLRKIAVDEFKKVFLRKLAALKIAEQLVIATKK